MTETKQDVFDCIAQRYSECLANVIYQNGNHYTCDEEAENKTDKLRARYAAAQAEVVKVPKAVWEYIKRCKGSGKGLAEASGILWTDYFENLSEDTSPLADWYVTGHNADTFARAYLAWANVEVRDED